MEVIERFQGRGAASTDAPEQDNNSSSINRILQRSKDRLAEKRQREEEPKATAAPSKAVKVARRGPQVFHTTGNAALDLRRQMLAEETPEEKRARKVALKQERNERREATKATGADAMEVLAKAGAADEDKVPVTAAPPIVSKAVVAKKKNKEEKEPITDKRVKEPITDKRVKAAVSKEAPQESEASEDDSAGSDGTSSEEEEEVTQAANEPTATATGVSISQQLFPTNVGGAASGKGLGQAGKAKQKGVEIEDVIESAYVSAEMIKLPVQDAVLQWKLDEEIATKLKNETSVVEFFPVQTAVIPVLLRMNSLECIRPRDVCVAAPTGSGKTLAYAIPILQNLLYRRVTRLRAVVLLPGRELVAQVYKVFKQLTKNTDLKVGMATGHSYFPDEQNFLCPEHARRSADSASSMGRQFSNENIINTSHEKISEVDLGSSSVDILVCTPGRLVDHIQFTKGFTLEHLRYLVLDEADRLLGNASDHWIRTLIRTIGSRSHSLSTSTSTGRPGGVQLLLFSATFTDNPRKLAMLGINAPLIIRVGAESGADSRGLETTLFDGDDAEEKTDGENTSAPSAASVAKVFNLPHLLKERVCIGEAADKPLLLASMLYEYCTKDDMKNKMILVFSSSVETTHRLCRLLQLVNDQFVGNSAYRYNGLVREMSSLVSSRDREAVMAEAAEGKVKVLVSSDHLARGIDLPNIFLVVNYDPPTYAKTYVHRVGRTARANRSGESITMLKLGQVGVFNKMRQTIGGGAISLTNNSEKSVSQEKYRPALDLTASLKPVYRIAIGRIQSVLAEEQSGMLAPIDDILINEKV